MTTTTGTRMFPTTPEPAAAHTPTRQAPVPQAPARPAPVPGPHLRVDWPRCKARGLCFELLPEIIRLDDWGYPVIEGAVTPELVAEAKEAVRACPTLALRLVAPR